MDSTRIDLESMGFNFSGAVERVQSWIDGLIQLLRNIIVAVVVIAIFTAWGTSPGNLFRSGLLEDSGIIRVRYWADLCAG
jgi:hypothetical protein